MAVNFLTSAAVRHAVRMAIAAVVASEFTSLLDLPEGYWAVITALVVMQGSLGGTLGAAADRVMATIAGGVLGVIGAWVATVAPVPQSLLLVLTTAPAAFLAMQRPSFRIAPVTAAMVLMMIGGPGGDALHIALIRLLEIAIGCIIGVTTAQLVLPGHARAVIQTSVVAVLKALGEAAQGLLARRSEDEIEPLNALVRRQLTLIDTSTAEAAKEQAVHMAAGPSPAPLVRSLRRLRSDVAILGRVMALQPTDAHDQPELGALLRAQFDGAAACLQQHSTLPDLAPLDAAIAAEADGSTLQFALITLRRDLADLGERLAEYTGSRDQNRSPSGGTGTSNAFTTPHSAT